MSEEKNIEPPSDAAQPAEQSKPEMPPANLISPPPAAVSPAPPKKEEAPAPPAEAPAPAPAPTPAPASKLVPPPAEPADATADDKEKKEVPAKKPRQPMPKSLFVLLILLIIFGVLGSLGYLGYRYLIKRSLSSQQEYQKICVTLKGELALFIDGDQRTLHCVSSLLDAEDHNRPCEQQSDCRGACVGDTSDTIYQPPDPASGDAALVPPVRCSKGIRLLPEFVAEAVAEDSEDNQ